MRELKQGRKTTCAEQADSRSYKGKPYAIGTALGERPRSPRPRKVRNFRTSFFDDHDLSMGVTRGVALCETRKPRRMFIHARVYVFRERTWEASKIGSWREKSQRGSRGDVDQGKLPWKTVQRITSVSAQERLRPPQGETEVVIGEPLIRNTVMLLKNLKVQNLRVSQRLSTWRPHLKVWRHMMEPMISWARLVSGRLTRSKAIQCAYFAQFVASTVQRCGKKGLVLYLKTAHTMLIHGLPGSVSTYPSRVIGGVAVARRGGGLPAVIPRYAREYIRKGDTSTIRFWLTMLGLYRIVLIDPVFKLNTITDPGIALQRELKVEWVWFVRTRFLSYLSDMTGLPLRDIGTDDLPRPTPFAIRKASADIPFVGPGERGPKTSFGTRWNSAGRWVSGQWGRSLLNYLSVIPGGYGTTKSLWTLMESICDIAAYTKANDTRECVNGSLANGRLSVKIEPAGKARVFAIVDYWTQVALKPLHDWIFSILEDIPQDGTYNQLEPVIKLLRKVSPDQTIYSYDLSAATDRLPVLLQGLLLAQIFGGKFAATWRRLLVGRNYYLGSFFAKAAKVADKGINLTYAVGQPMGAYSSWGMLALTHHAIVQYAAYKAGYKQWFDLYAVLGDDIVIAHDGTAKQYVKFCERIGLGIGIAKSLVAKGKTLEFAKKLYFRGEHVSGLPLKFWAAAQNTLGVAHALSAWYPGGSLANFVRALGTGFKGASKVALPWARVPQRLRILLVLLTQPLSGGTFAFKTWVDWLTSSSPYSGAGYDPYAKVISFVPWATSLMNDVVIPAKERLDQMQEDIFFTGPLDLAGRLVDKTANEAVAKTQKTLEAMEKTVQHLHRQNISLVVSNVSAIWQQVVNNCGKVDLITPSCNKALKRPPENEIVSVVDFFRLWVRLRRRIVKGDLRDTLSNEGKGEAAG